MAVEINELKIKLFLIYLLYKLHYVWNKSMYKQDTIFLNITIKAEEYSAKMS